MPAPWCSPTANPTFVRATFHRPRQHPHQGHALAGHLSQHAAVSGGFGCAPRALLTRSALRGGLDPHFARRNSLRGGVDLRRASPAFLCSLVEPFSGTRSCFLPGFYCKTSFSSGLRRKLGSRPTRLGLGLACLAPSKGRIGPVRRHLPNRQRSDSRCFSRRSHFPRIAPTFARHARTNGCASSGSNSSGTFGMDDSRKHRRCTAGRCFLRFAR